MGNRKAQRVLMAIGGFFILGIILLALPPIRNRMVWRIEQLRTRIFYSLFPPEEAVFQPQDPNQQVEDIVRATFQALTQTAQYVEPFIVTTMTPAPTAVITATPLPAQVALQGVRYEDQHGLWNYCAPATLSMALSYWGWEGNRLVTGQYLKPFEKDKNVMLYEMVNFVQDETDLRALQRYGGTQELLKALIASGFPVVIEKGTYIVETTTGKRSWMGHYNVLTGYDDLARNFIVQDSYYSPDYLIQYDLLMQEWRSFDYTFMVIYPPGQESEVLAILGDYADPIRSDQIAAEIALKETQNLTGVDLFFAWFNRGTSLVRLQDYIAAATAYDQAFRIYPDLPKDLRPWRIVWYQTGPYFAYYYSGRYQDVLELANTTLESASEPYLEESFYWRARAKIALGDRQGAIDDLRISLKYHPGFKPSEEILRELGVSN